MTVTTAQYTQTGGTLALNLGDRIVVTGSGTPLTLAGLLDVTALPGYSITPGVYTLFDNQNTTPVAGRFYGRPEGATVSVGDRNLIISYFGAAYVGDPYSNNVILTLSAPPPFRPRPRTRPRWRTTITRRPTKINRCPDTFWPTTPTRTGTPSRPRC